MKQLLERIVQTFSFILVLIVCFVSYPKAQILEKDTDDIEIPIIQKIGSTFYNCYSNNGIYDETSFKKLIALKPCEYAGAFLKPDFNTQTLIGYRVSGDCFMRVSVKVFRNDHRKKYKVEITNYWGRCRAGGSFEGWLTIDKIPADYNLEFHVILSDHMTKRPLFD